MLDLKNTDIFLYLKISEETSRDRVLSRKRTDDTFSFWEQRMQIERERLTSLVISSGAIVISSEDSPIIVFGRIKDAIQI